MHEISSRQDPYLLVSLTVRVAPSKLCRPLPLVIKAPDLTVQEEVLLRREARPRSAQTVRSFRQAAVPATLQTAE